MTMKHIHGTSIEVPEHMMGEIVSPLISESKRQAAMIALTSFRTKHGLKSHCRDGKKRGNVHASADCSSLESDAPHWYINQFGLKGDQIVNREPSVKNK